MSTSSENENSLEENEAENYNEEELAASDTESDEDVSNDDNDEDEDEDDGDDDDDDGENEDDDDDDEDGDEDEDEDEDDDDDESEGDDNVEKPNTVKDRVTEELVKRYEGRQGKQLFIRFPQKLPTDEKEFEEKVHALSPLIVKAHKPRQKHARFCLIDFKSREDRDAAMKSIKAATKKTPDSKLVVSLPRTENENFVQELVERKIKSIENKRAKSRLRRASKLAMHEKDFTSSIVVVNLPKSATVTDVRKLYPNAVDIQIKVAKGNMNSTTLATITLPSTMEARAAFKQKHSFNGTQLVVRFDKPKVKQQKKKTNSKGNKKSFKSKGEQGAAQQVPHKKQQSGKGGSNQEGNQKSGAALPLVRKTKGGNVEEPPAKKIKKSNADVQTAGQKIKKNNTTAPQGKKLNVSAAKKDGQSIKKATKLKQKSKNK